MSGILVRGLGSVITFPYCAYVCDACVYGGIYGVIYVPSPGWAKVTLSETWIDPYYFSFSTTFLQI